MTAAALEVGRAIANRLTAGSLQGVRVGRTRFVLASAIVKTHADRDGEIAIIEAEIVKVARAGRTTPYTPLTAEIGRLTAVSHERKWIGKILGEISRRSQAEHNFLLTVLVINATLDRPSDPSSASPWRSIPLTHEPSAMRRTWRVRRGSSIITIGQ